MTDQAPCYRIVDWEKHFEISQSKRAGKITWVAVPNKHDGKTFRRIARHPRAPELYAAWQLLVQVASKMPTRGVLRDEDGPTRSVDLADMTGFPQCIFDLAFDVLSTREFRWLEVVKNTESPPPLGVASEHDLPRYPTGRDVQDETIRGVTDVSAAPAGANFGVEFERIVNARKNWHGITPDYESYRMAHHSRGIQPDKVIDEIVTLVKNEPAHRWEKYGFAKCIGYILDDIAKRFERVGNQNTRQTMSDIVGDSEENIRKALS